MTDDDPHLLLGAYVLGGLTLHDRARFEDHLTSCTRCRHELAATAGIPALLRLAPPAPAPAPGPDVSTVAPPVLIATRPHPRRLQRRTRRILTGAVAALAAVAAVTVFAVLGPGSARSDATFTAAGSASVTGSAIFDTRPWGTAIELDLAHLPSHGTFVLEVRSRTGATERAATWGGTTRPQIQVTAATSIPSSDITRLQIRAITPRNQPIADAQPAA